MALRSQVVEEFLHASIASGKGRAVAARRAPCQGGSLFYPGSMPPSCCSASSAAFEVDRRAGLTVKSRA